MELLLISLGIGGLAGLFVAGGWVALSLVFGLSMPTDPQILGVVLLGCFAGVVIAIALWCWCLWKDGP